METEIKEKESIMSTILQIMAIPMIVFIIFGPVIWFTYGKDQMIERRIRKAIHAEILKNNKVAIAIKCEGYSWMVRSDNEDLILAALAGNESAIQALKINIDCSKKRY